MAEKNYPMTFSVVADGPEVGVLLHPGDEVLGELQALGGGGHCKKGSISQTLREKPIGNLWELTSEGPTVFGSASLNSQAFRSPPS